jgi:hypothetical protein
MRSYAEQCIAFVDNMAFQFPGLVDGETEVNGADLVESICDCMPERSPDELLQKETQP